jgi:hypothetical protein
MLAHRPLLQARKAVAALLYERGCLDGAEMREIFQERSDETTVEGEG